MQPSNRPSAAALTSASPRAARSAQLDRGAQLALVQAARAPVQVGVAEALVLHVGDQAALVEVVELDRGQPRAQQAAGVLGGEVAADGALARVALAQQPAHHRQHALGRARRGRLPAPGVGVVSDARRAPASARPARSRRAPTSRRCPARRGRATRPARTCARNSAGVRAARRFGVGASDVDAGVVVGAADADAVARGDVRRRGAVELAARGRRCGPPRPRTAPPGAGGGAR